jgi:ABC-type arginine transport system permease subunit
MADKTSTTNPFASDQGRITAATAIGMNAWKPIMQFQVSMLRMWADNIERFAGNYQKGLEETATAAEKQLDKERAA